MTCDPPHPPAPPLCRSVSPPPPIFFFGIGASIRIGQEMWCLPLQDFLRTRGLFNKHLCYLLMNSFSWWSHCFRSSKHHNFQTVRAREVIFWENVHPEPYVTCHLSPVTCHLSTVTCHLSQVISHLSHVSFAMSHFFLHFFLSKKEEEEEKESFPLPKKNCPPPPVLVTHLKNVFLLIYVFLSALFKRVCVSRLQDFYQLVPLGGSVIKSSCHVYSLLLVKFWLSSRSKELTNNFLHKKTYFRKKLSS